MKQVPRFNKTCIKCGAQFIGLHRSRFCSLRCNRVFTQWKLRQERMAWFAKIKDQPCADCGNKFPACCMDFDHRPGEKKNFNLGSSRLRTEADRLSEIAKCDLVCANCHRLRTWKRIHSKET